MRKVNVTEEWQRRMDAAVTVERERCAEIAENFVDWDASMAVKAVAAAIAGAIRGRP